MFSKCMLNLLFSWKCEHKCALDFQAFIISCICVEADHFLFQWYLHKLCNAIIKYFWYKSINSKPVPGPGFRVLVAPGKTPLFHSSQSHYGHSLGIAPLSVCFCCQINITMRCSMLSFCGKYKYCINLRILNPIKQINA